jgi:anti-anti-sigma factor
MRPQPRHSHHATTTLPAEPPALEVTVDQAAGLRLVVARGDLDVATAAKLDDALQITPAEPLDLLVDLSRVEFIDSAGGHGLERAASAQAAAGRQFAIACTGGSEVARFFETLAASCLELPVHHSRANALRAALAMPGDEPAPPRHRG